MQAFKLSKRTPHEDARESLPSLHEAKLQELNNLQKSLPQKLGRLGTLRDTLTYVTDNDRIRNLSQEIKKLAKEVRSIELREEESKYLLKAAPYLLEYHNEGLRMKAVTEQETPSLSTEENGYSERSLGTFVKTTFKSKKGDICRRYKHDCLSMSDGRVPRHVEESFCSNCDGSLEVISREASIVCRECGLSKDWRDTSGGGEYMEEIEVLSPFAYKRINHFKEWVQQLQAKETTSPPDEVISALLEELRKARITETKEITPRRIKGYLKKLRMNKQYEHIPAIINRICGKSPPKMSRELENQLITMFEQIQTPFEKHCPKNRKNFLSYSYTLHKLCQLLDEDEFLVCFPLLKSREKLYQQDTIWKGICSELNWAFVPSL